MAGWTRAVLNSAILAPVCCGCCGRVIGCGLFGVAVTVESHGFVLDDSLPNYLPALHDHPRPSISSLVNNQLTSLVLTVRSFIQCGVCELGGLLTLWGILVGRHADLSSTSGYVRFRLLTLRAWNR